MKDETKNLLIVCNVFLAIVVFGLVFPNPPTEEEPTEIYIESEEPIYGFVDAEEGLEKEEVEFERYHYVYRISFGEHIEDDEAVSIKPFGTHHYETLVYTGKDIPETSLANPIEIDRTPTTEDIEIVSEMNGEGTVYDPKQITNAEEFKSAFSYDNQTMYFELQKDVRVETRYSDRYQTQANIQHNGYTVLPDTPMCGCLGNFG